MNDIDSVTKDYMKDPATFADAFNFLLYDGEQIIKPEQLKEIDTNMLTLPFGENGEVMPIQKSRDGLKILVAMEDKDAAYCILGNENQTEINYAMPVRVGLYDMIQYSNQVETANKSHRKSKNYGTHAEFLSGFHKDDRILPVITLVIYFGADKWDAPKSIHDMLYVCDERLLKFVPDYKINLIAPSELSDDELEKFKTELCELLKFIKYSNDKSKLLQVVENDKNYENISRKTANAIKTITHSELKVPEKEEKMNMCKALEDLKRDAYEEGRKAQSIAIEEMKRDAYEEGRKAQSIAIEEVKKDAIAEGEAKGLAKLKQALERLIATGMEEKRAKEILGL